MTLNINTLKLDIQYLQDNDTLSRLQMTQIEQQLAVFIEESLASLSLTRLPKILIQAQSKGDKNITLANMEIQLPVIDAEEFLQGQLGYFNVYLKPALQRAFYEALSISAHQGIKSHDSAHQGIELEDSAHEDVHSLQGDGLSWWQNFQQLLQFNTGPLAFSHSPNAHAQQGRLIVPQLIKYIKTSKIFRQELKQQLLIPQFFNRIYNWLEKEENIKGFMTSLFPYEDETNQNKERTMDSHIWVDYFNRPELSASQKRTLIKHVVELAVCQAGHDRQHIQALLELSLKSRLLSREFKGADKNLTVAMNALQEALLQGQTKTWLKHCHNWLAVIMHQGLRQTDVVALENLLKRAKGYAWHAEPESDTVFSQVSGLPTTAQPAAQDLFYGGRQLQSAHKICLSLLAPLQQFNGDLNALWWHVTKIKHFLKGQGRLLSKALVIKIQNSLQDLADSQQTKHNLITHTFRRLEARADQLVENMTSLLEGTDSHAYQKVGLILTDLNELALSCWLPLSLKSQLDEVAIKLSVLVGSSEPGLLLASDLKDPLQIMLRQLALWKASLPTQARQNAKEDNAKQASPSVPWLATKNVLDCLALVPSVRGTVFKENASKLFNYANDLKLANKKLTDENVINSSYDDVNSLKKNSLEAFALAVQALLSYRFVPATLQQDIHHYLANVNPESRAVLQVKLQRFMNQDTQLNEVNAKILTSAEARQVFKHEQNIQTQIHTILEALFERLNVNKGVNKNPEQATLGLAILNKQQLFEMLNQILLLLQAQKSTPSADVFALDAALQKLLKIKSRLLTLDSELAQAKEPWWLPLVNMQEESLSERPVKTAGGPVMSVKPAMPHIPSMPLMSDVSDVLAKPIKKKRIDKTIRLELLARLQLCTQSLQANANVLDLSRSRHSSQAFEALIEVILQVCDYLYTADWSALADDSALKQAVAVNEEKSQEQNKGKDKTSNKELSREQNKELKKELKKWASTALSFLRDMPEKKIATFSQHNKQTRQALIALMSRWLKLSSQDCWPAKQVQDCEMAMGKLLSETQNFTNQHSINQEPTQKADNQETIAAQQIHEIIWTEDLSSVQTILKSFSLRNVAAKNSVLLLNHHRQKIQSLIPSKKIHEARQEVKQSLQGLIVAAENSNEHQISVDGGLVLIWPYLKDFFKNNQLIESALEGEWQFISEAARATAHGLLVSLLGCEQDGNTWAVANLLCGYDSDTLFIENLELSDQQEASAEKLLQAVIHNWPALKNMSVASFRELFLLRPAQVYENQEGWCIEVEPKTIDVLLTKLPWGLGYLSLPWLGKALIQVKWQYGF